MNHSSLIEKLLESKEPSLHWKIRVNVLDQDRQSAEIKALENEIGDSPRVQALLQKVDDSGFLRCHRDVYDKWQGTHWVLMTLADIGYPQGDESLYPLANAVLNTWLDTRYFNEFIAEKKQNAYKRRHAIPVMQGRHRTCASQQGNALYSILKLGLEDERLDQLAERLNYWQWPDGGWNCDKKPNARTSTFIHSLYAMRGLAVYAQKTGDEVSMTSALKSADFFLKRRLYKRASDGQNIKDEFTKLHYPLYWHYDILGALKVFAEIGLTKDERFSDALDLLEKKVLPAGGWPAEGRYYKKVSSEFSLNADFVDWGGVGKRKLNEWVTADALFVLKRFGRLKV